MPYAIKLLFFLADLLSLNGAIMLPLLLSDVGSANAADEVYLIVFSNLSWLFLTLVSNPYSITKGLSLERLLKTQFSFIFTHLLVLGGLVLFLGRIYEYKILFSYLLFVPAFVIVRILTYYARNIITVVPATKNYITIGDSPEQMRKYFALNPHLGYRFQGSFSIEQARDDLQRIRDYCAQKEVHEIFCFVAESNDVKALVEFGLNTMIKTKVVLATATNQEIPLERQTIQPTQSLSLIALDEKRNAWAKRIFDIFFSGAVLLLIMSWLVPLVGLLIIADSRGGIFFKQQRSGKGNQPFWCFKFRTMKVNHHADKLQATKGDPRITKLGAFLRKSSIDELPQFINVFLGEMSVVGPRPHMLKHTEEYSKLIDKFMGRQYVKPGITGLAQCMGYRGETKTLADMENRVRLDRYYIENWSFWLDIKIIFLTVISLIRGSEKAY